MKATNKNSRKSTAAQPQKTPKKRKPKLSNVCQTYRSRDSKNGWTNKDYALDMWIAAGGIITPDEIIPTLHKDISPNVVASWLSGFDRGGAHPGYPRSARERTTEIVATLKNIGVTDAGVFSRAKAIADSSVPLQAKTAPKKKTPKKKTAKRSAAKSK